MPLFGDTWDNATPLGGEAQYFGADDFEELETGENEKPGEGDPDAATAFLAGAVVDRWDEIQGIARDQMFSVVDETVNGQLGTLFEDSHSTGITLTDIQVWGGQLNEDEFADEQTEHAGAVANNRPNAENALYFATPTDSNVDVLKRMAENERVTREEVGDIVNNRQTYETLSERQQQALDFLYNNWSHITGSNAEPMSIDAMGEYAEVMGTSLERAQQNVSDVLSMETPAAENTDSSALSIMGLEQANAMSALTLLSSPELASYVQYESGDNPQPFITRDNVNALLDQPPQC